MRRLRGSRPSPALVVAVLALVGALAGTAVAEQATTSVSKKKTKKIARKQANKQIDARLPWGTEAIADGAVTDAKLAEGAVTAPAIGNVVARVADFPLPANSNQADNVFCQPGEQLTGGGARSIGFQGDMVSSRPIKSDGADPVDGEDDLQGWRAAFQNPTATATSFRLYAICLQ